MRLLRVNQQSPPATRHHGPSAKDSLKSTDKASFVRLLIQIGQEHPDGLTRVRALCRAADLMNWRTTDVDDADRPIMYVPEIAELDDWERIAAESQRMLLFDTRDGAPISRSSR